MATNTASVNNEHFEIEHKYLCVMPTKDLLEAKASAIVQMEQTYLKAPKGEERRVRKKTSQNLVSYAFTSKRKITELKRVEEEHDISEEEYQAFLKEADPKLHTIKKTRYKIPYCNHVFEVDVYEFDSERCVMEVEISSETEEFVLPPFIHVLKEVTEDGSYKNKALAKTLALSE